MKRTLILTVFLLVITAVLSVAIMPTETVSVLVQADDVATAKEVVLAYGGQVNESLDIIAAVSADVTPRQLRAITSDPRV
ncbi:MAG: hypothetical protein D6706_05825, partial [Chloroflexi bacterium]